MVRLLPQTRDLLFQTYCLSTGCLPTYLPQTAGFFCFFFAPLVPSRGRKAQQSHRRGWTMDMEEGKLGSFLGSSWFDNPKVRLQFYGRWFDRGKTWANNKGHTFVLWNTILGDLTQGRTGRSFEPRDTKTEVLNWGTSSQLDFARFLRRASSKVGNPRLS